MTSRPTAVSVVHGALARCVFAVVVLVSLAVLFTPASGVPSAPPGVDKVVHVLLFGVLAVSGRWAGVGRGVLGVVLVVYASISELLQSLPVLNRSTSVADLLADVAGVAVGLLVWDAVARTRATRPR
ncbi:VanZ family protein [Modestobacter sp. VKM Ac-2985]|uniref:VanZ family protein n=1 Tax=Modestobacter sp. VKM Ac-2985 TaxID=3004139 RepID=UPI0022ABA3A2|nr:VanZ family protein [Modestobacter sp. VKM Ac-2985]MCZ2840183.1 VanZ family protein [Modestobacter sp. VKM Ac-2985]